MKFTLPWLKEHLATDAPLSAICDRLTMLGLEVEGVSDPGGDLEAFSVAWSARPGSIPTPTGCGCARWRPGTACSRWCAARPTPVPA